MSQTPQPPLGGRYELRRQLATTPAARVYLAQDLELGRPVAVKVLGPELARDPRLVERFRQSANAAAAVHDPRIVTIYDWGDDNGAVYVAMEYVDGPSLAETLRDSQRLGIAPAINIGVSVAGALDAAHRAGLVHGSLTPRDVLLAGDGTVKVTDFGTATAGLATIAGPTMTATYQAPEQLQGQPADPRSDLYALGGLLYESLTGSPPFTGPDAVTITQRKLSERAIPPSATVPGIPPGLDAIIDRLLDRDPARRYSSGTDVATDLIRLGETVEVSLAPPTVPVPTVAAATTTMPVTPPVATRPPPTEEPKKRSATGWIIAAIVVLVLAVGGLVAWAVSQNDQNQADQVTVPAVVGQRAAEAEAAITAVGLNASTVNEPNDQFAEGLVFAQAPPGAAQARKGSVVVLKVSSGPTTTTSSSSSTTSSSSTSTTTTTTTSTTTTTTNPPTTTTT